MPEAEAQIQASSPEERQMIRHFSIQRLQTAPNSEYPNVNQAVADYAEAEHAKEAATWRLRFQSQDFQSDEAMTNLRNESTELQRVVEDFAQVDNTGLGSYLQVRNAVTDAAETWEGKRRLFLGKPQKAYHNFMCNLDAHSGLLSLLPQSNDYVTIIAGAVKTIVKVGTEPLV